ncbi:unnamed protein product [Lactuca virosa]|uniref:Uncharacterized protein n=1 Tax=Lactuca virosa TaxID=75947 RepID=A0AAU9MG14_9ASTR|nr:unnamed protein product [Lactuca virosa]
MARASENGKVKGGDGGGGGGKIRIGSTGKVSALMMQEIDSNLKKTSSKKPAIRIQTAPVSISCGAESTRRFRRMVAVSGGSSSNGHHQVKPGKKKTTHKIPMLDSEDLWVDKTPIRGKERKKVTQRIVETVDLKCGKNDGDWSIIPISSQLRRLSFSKISD